MNKKNESNKSEQNISDIRINKKMRLWNKYRNYIIGVAGILAVILIVVFVIKGCGKSGSDGSDKVTDANQITVGTKESSDQTTQAATNQTQPSTTQVALANKVYTTTRPIAKEEFTTTSFYDNSVFLGDFIVSGIAYYGFLGKDKVIADTNLTTDKALSNVDQLASSAPQKVFIMLGINDLNYGVRGVDTIAANYATLIAQIKAKLPSAKIYILSVLPITQAYESKANVYIRKANLDQLNTKLKELVSTSGVDYLELGAPFQSSTGYLNESATSNGLNISSDYYGYLLNTIADMLK